MVERFDNTGTPLYNQGPYTRLGGGLTFGLPAKDDARMASLQRNTCDDVVRAWGRWLCGYFAHDLIPGLRALQTGSTPEDRTAFLAALRAGDDARSLATQGVPFDEFNALIGATDQMALADRYREA